MSSSTPQLPEPLQSFAGLEGSLSSELKRLDDLSSRYRRHLVAGRVLPNTLDALRVELTYHSNAIEGSTLTLRETHLVLEGLAPSGGKSLREIYEARNHDRAFRMIEQWVRERDHTVAITERDILEVHAAVLADIDVANAGRFRSDRVLIRGTRFVPPGSHKFGELVPGLLELANLAGTHPALRAAALHYNLVAVHPFTDGNGRTARLMMNYLAMRHGYPMVLIEVERRGEYLAALEEANAGRCAAFAAFVTSSIQRSIERLIGEDEGGDT